MCSADCQECFADVYNACGGCKQSGRGDFGAFDAKIGPAVKRTAETMGCNNAAHAALAMILALAAVFGHALNSY